MKVSKLVEILNSLPDKETDVVFDTYKTCDDFIYGNIYDLTNVNIEYKNNKTLIKFAFEERENNKPKNECRMKNMNIKLLDEIRGKEENE